MDVPDYNKELQKADRLFKDWEKRTNALNKALTKFEARVKTVKTTCDKKRAKMYDERAKADGFFAEWLQIANAIVDLQQQIKVGKRSLSKNEKKDLEKQISSLERDAKAKEKQVDRFLKSGDAVYDEIDAAIQQINAI